MDIGGYGNVGSNLQQVFHSVKEHTHGQLNAYGIESFWSLLKRGYYGICHYMHRKHIQRYFNEFMGRYNIREQDIDGSDCVFS